MSPALLYLLMIICLLMHACNARCLGINDKGIRKEFLSNRDAPKINLPKSKTPLELMHQVYGELGPQGKPETGKHVTISQEGFIGSTIRLGKNLEAILKEERGTKGATSGNKDIVSSQIHLQHAAKPETIKRKRRSLLAPVSDYTEEAVNSGESDATEDAVAMDYAQPHRKPPIHNKKP